ncbi:MAG: pantetheine-phosphate adenylyltransferase, partial [Gemmatimonadetes bacterium]|nr:pantetheine-phosphate adenylyltransferase [Gemmatimonadota bacterium]
MVGLYPGTFDPITRGHEDLVERSLRVVDELVIGVASDTSKEPLFGVEERVGLIEAVVEDEPRVRVESFSGLTVEFAGEIGASIILRGLRAVSDFEFEFQMALMNKHLAPGIEILFMAPDAAYSFLSASLVREVAGLGGDVEAFVAPVVVEALARKFGDAR